MKGGLNWSKYQAPKEPTSTMGQATYGLRNMASRAKFMVTPSQQKRNWFSRKLGFGSQAVAPQ